VKGRGESVLVVESDEQVSTMLCVLLTRHGYSPLRADNADDAHALCDKHATPIHLLITNVALRHITGAELAARLLPLRPEMKILYVSSSPQTVDGDGDGRVAFFQKPITVAAFLQCLRKLLDADKT